MACKFLTGKKIRQCNADGIMLPSSGELAIFCEKDERTACQCQIYRTRIRKDSLPRGWNASDLNGYTEFPVPA